MNDSGSKCSASTPQGFGLRPRSATRGLRSALLGQSRAGWSFVSLFQSARLASTSTTRFPSPRPVPLRRVVVPRSAFFRFRSTLSTFTCRPRGSLAWPLLPAQVASGPLLPSNMGALLAPSLRRCSGSVEVRAVVLSARFQSARKGGPVEVPGGSSVLVGRATSGVRSALGILTTACRRRRPDVVTAGSSFRVAQHPAAAPEAGR